MNFYDNSLCVVIPIGVSIEGTPVQHYLEQCVQSIKNQNNNFKIQIIVAADSNIPQRCKNFLNKNKIITVWYEPHYYYRKGGIWKKIYDQWEKTECKYVAFCHYDDIWHENRVKLQIDFMNKNNLETSWSSVQQINVNGEITSEDISSLSILSELTIHDKTYAFCHSSITNKESLFKLSIIEEIVYSSAIYEDLFFIYSHALKGKKCNDSIFYHRVHNCSLTSTFGDESRVEVVSQRKSSNYSLQETLMDADKICLSKIKEKILNNFIQHKMRNNNDSQL